MNMKILIVALVVFGASAIYFLRTKSTEKTYQIIYFNGPSSAGKSTVARALQNNLAEPFLVIGIDQIIHMMPEKMNDWLNETEAPGFSWHSIKNNRGDIEAYKIHIGPYGKKMRQALKDVIVALAKSGNNIIIDDVSFGKEAVDEWRSALHDFNVLWVGITAPIEEIEKREKERGDRRLGSARWQIGRVHTDVDYDILINTHAHGIAENVQILVDKLTR